MVQSGATSTLATLVITCCVVSGPGPRAWAHGDLHGQIDEVSAQLASELKKPAGRDSHEAHERGHERAKLFLERGELYRQHGDWRRAEADYDQAARNEPDNESIELARGQMLLESGDPGRARPVLERFLTRNVDHPQALLTHAQVLVKLGQGPRAVRLLDRALRRHPQPEPDHYLARAEVLASLGRSQLPRALRGLDEGITRLGPIVSLDGRAIDLELALGRTAAALRRIDRQAALTGRRDMWLARRAEVLDSAGKKTGARAARQQALDALTALPPHLQSRPTTRQLKQQLLAALSP
jgi:tetratricopeptide (TPR) repeat protein